MPRAGAVWVDVLPNMAEFRRQLRRELEEPVRESSRRSGEQGGEGLMQGMAGKMKAGALAAGVAAGALVAKGVAVSLEKSAASGKLQGSLGLSDKAAAKAGNAAGRLYANGVTESVEEGADAVKRIMSAGLAPPKATTKQLASIATKTQDLASLFEIDLGQAANAAGQAVKTGLAKNADEALDSMFRGFQVMGPRADDLADTLNEYSTIFRSLNLPIRTVTGLLSQGMAAGARDTDVVADALKEFQIRATDGSTSSAAGFKALGLSAKGMTAQIAKGGKGASDGLQTVLDRLRDMKDPVKRNAAAVALFGTKAEDMGRALFALDPSKAEKDLGRVGGAAKKAGDDLRKNAGAQFEVFKRRALMAVGDAAARYAIPGLLKLGHFLNDDVLPPVKDTAGWLGDHLAPALKTTGNAIGGTVRWVREWGIWLSPLAVVIGGVTLALSAQAIVTSAVIGVMSAYALASRGIAAVTRAWAAAQALMNAVMALNPFVLVAIAVVALGVALVIAWKRSETFRNIVLGAWAAIQKGALWLWTNGIKPMVDGFMTGLRWVGTAAVWLWGNVLSPTFSAIGTGARILATIFTILVILPIWNGLKLLGGVFSWLWSAAVKPTLGWIAAGALWLWGVVQIQLGYFQMGLHALGAAGLWLWRSAFQPAYRGIVAGGLWLWAGAKVAFAYFMAGLHLLGATGTWLWRNALQPAFRGIASVAVWLYEKGLKPPIDRGKRLAHELADAFRSAKDAIGSEFGKLKNLTKAPIAFIVNTVYGKGIRPTWNTVAAKFGAPQLPEVKGFARGGVLPGQSSYKQGDDQLMPMRRGEGVAVSEAMRDPYERARLLAVNKAAMQGRSLRPFQGEGFAKGGIFDWVKSAASKTVDVAESGVNWLKDGIKASAMAGLNSVVKPLISKISGSPSLYLDMVKKIPSSMVKTILGFAGTADTKLEAAGIGGPGFKSGLSWARTQAGKPYQWGGNGDPSWDCSGFVSAIESVIRGQSPHRRWATGSFSGATAPPGWVLNKRSPYQIGITNAGVGHTAGTINGVNVESRGGDGVIVGSRARSYRDGLFTHHYGFAAKGYADGGKPRPGEIAWVGEQGPELVKFGSGKTEVFNHRDSMRMWDGIGARGFAKGTSGAKARAKARSEIPGDLNAFTKSLTGSASDIAKAAAELAKDLKAAGLGSKSLTSSVSKASSRLQAMAKQRDAVSAKISAAKSAAADQKKFAADYLGLSNFSEATSIQDVLSGMQTRQGSLKSFQAGVQSLSKRGLSKDLIGQIEAMGPDSAQAQMLLHASSGQIKQFNALSKSGAKLTTGYGNALADAMFDSGKAGARGFLTGLLAEEKTIQDAMAKLGAGAVKAIRSKKGIDAHSPSRKAHVAGRDLGAGLVAGMAEQGPAIESAAARLGAAAVPAGLVPVTSGSSAQTASSGLAGRPLYLVVEDGTVLRAYVDDRVDTAFSDVRRAKRSGTRG